MSVPATVATPPMLERLARGVGLIALVVALGAMLWPTVDSLRANTLSSLRRIDAQREDSASAVARELALAIVAQGSQRTPGRVAALFALPSQATRAVLGAALDGGVPLRWIDSTGVRALAVHASVEATPQPSVVIVAGVSATSTSSNASAALTLRDVGGVIDSAYSREPALSVRVARLRAPLRATYSSHGAVRNVVAVHVPSALRVRGVLLYAQPGWDAKFTTAALEESGWHVDGALSVAPNTRMRVGTPKSADTSHSAAGLVLDSGVVTSRVLEAFVAQGGGVVIAGDALRDPSLSHLANVRIVGLRNPLAGALLTSTPKRGLSELQLVSTSPAVTMEREGVTSTVFATRRGVGRVVASGYRNTWHWRMEGTDASLDDHRRWWNGLVGAIAAATDTSNASVRAVAERDALPGDAAPMADLVARLGPASHDDLNISGTSRSYWPPSWLLITIAMLALIIEWALRRLRGAP